MVTVLEGQPRIHHAQARAENHHAAARIKRRVAPRTDAHREILIRRRLFVMADGKHCVVGRYADAAGEADIDAPGCRRDGRDDVVDKAQPSRLLLHQIVEKLVQINPVEAARRVVGYGSIVRQASGMDPAPEMFRIIGERAHSHGADIEEMIRQRCRIGHALTEGVAFLDQCDAKSGIVAGQQMRCQDDARRPAADNRNVGRGAHAYRPAMRKSVKPGAGVPLRCRRWRFRASRQGFDCPEPLRWRA